jgi:long-chain fatty acid transport protein
MKRLALAVGLLAVLEIPPAAAAFGRFQHGGRGTAQAGALVARADEPSAVGYNPAAIARLDEGLGLQLGLDFDAPTEDASSATRDASAEHTIQFPPAAYLAWRPRGARWALGLGFDAPLWRLVDWQTFDFPGRFVARSSEARLFELHPVAAVALDGGWSVGGGLRWVQGEASYGDARRDRQTSPLGDFDIEVDRLAEADVDGLGYDLGVHWSGSSASFGARWRSEVELDGRGDLSYRVRDPAALPPEVLAAARARLATGATRIADALPARATAGAAWRATENLVLELDAELALWSSLDAPSVADEPERLGPGFEIGRRAGWDDTLSWRFGAELELIEGWSAGAGLAWEPSPVSADAIEPGAPQGDAVVASLGGTWSGEIVTFDLGWSFHRFDDQTARGQEPDPDVRTTYSGHAQVWALSARWRF